MIKSDKNGLREIIYHEGDIINVDFDICLTRDIAIFINHVQGKFANIRVQFHLNHTKIITSNVEHWNDFEYLFSDIIPTNRARLSNHHKYIATIREISKPVYKTFKPVSRYTGGDCKETKAFVGSYDTTTGAYFQHDFRGEYKYSILGPYNMSGQDARKKCGNLLGETKLLKNPYYVLILELLRKMAGSENGLLPWKLMKLKYMAGVWAGLENTEYMLHNLKYNPYIMSHICSYLNQSMQNQTSVRAISGCYGDEMCYNFTHHLGSIPLSIMIMNYNMYCLGDISILYQTIELCSFFSMSLLHFPVLLILPCKLHIDNAGVFCQSSLHRVMSKSYDKFQPNVSHMEEIPQKYKSVTFRCIHTY